MFCYRENHVNQLNIEFYYDVPVKNQTEKI